MDIYSYNLYTDITPRQPAFSYIDSDLPSRDNFSSPESAYSPYSSSSPSSPPTTNTSFSMSPASTHESLPKSDAEQDYSNTLLASLSTKASSPQSHSQRSTRPNPPRKGDPAYIPRPENAFILFRKDAVQKIRLANAEPPPSTGKCEKGKRQRQADMSKSISQMWKALSREQRAVWEERAARIKREHEAKHPEYRYQPSRPGTSALRKGAAVKRVAAARQRKQEWDEDEFSTDISEDVAIVTNTSRRLSTSSPISPSSPSSSIALPSLDPFAATGFAPPEPIRQPSSSRQWVQPPLEDPSPPPAQIYFPRGGNLQPSLMPRDEQISRRPHSRLNISQVPAEEPEDVAPIFVEPITSERNPWSPSGSRMARMPSTPRRSSIRAAASRARSNSVPHVHLRPLQIPSRRTEDSYSPSQMSEPEIDSASSFQPPLPWSPEHPQSLAQLQSLESLEMLSSPDASFATSPASSQGADFASIGSNGFGFTEEELTEFWQATVQSNEPSSFDLDEYSALLDSSGLFIPQQDEEMREPPSTSFPYQIDTHGRRGSNFF